MEKYKQEQAKIDQGSHGFNVKESLWTLQKKDKNALDKKERNKKRENWWISSFGLIAVAVSKAVSRCRFVSSVRK